ncbi:unnamed protein product [Cuscuta europaea]|uniref:Uncharacterized protein n=1 Tax=Cuscuta europaea TaxID=41803 RepID=A0A9P0YHG2_CUSEU|nr:unnamed protein product [Cuscuta europaea]
MSKGEEVMDDFNEEDDLDDCIERPQRRQKTKKKHLLRKASDDRVEVEVNEFGVLWGDGWTNLSNYIGVVVRDNVPIIYDDWRNVPAKVKDDCWNYLCKLFVLTPTSQKQVFSTMSAALRNFRFTLRNEFILHYKEGSKKLRFPPEEFKHILTDEWRLFVKNTFKQEFKAKSEKAKERRKNIRYNHRLGSGGYAEGLKKKQKELGGMLKDIDRADTWLLGRKKKKWRI